MEKMLNDYLQFAKNQVIENTNQIDLNSLFNEIKNLIDNKNLRIECESDINFNGRPGALKRSFHLNLLMASVNLFRLSEFRLT